MKKTYHAHRTHFNISEMFSKNLAFVGLATIILVFVVYSLYMKYVDLADRVVNLENKMIVNSVMIEESLKAMEKKLSK
jgi:hypothetical protein